MDLFLKEAFGEALLAYREGEVPIGCVIVKDGVIIARSHNRMERDKQASAHAEMRCIEQASRVVSDWRLHECQLYVTIEPCLMCTGAIVQSRIGELHIGAWEPNFGAVASKVPVLLEDLLPNRTKIFYYDERVCAYLMQRFFRMRRRERETKK